MKEKILQFLSIVIVLILALAFVVRFAGPSLLRQYIEAGVGNCVKNPILCKVPDSNILKPQVDKNSTADFIPYKFPKMTIEAPKGFSVVQEMIKKYYYKKDPSKRILEIIYVLHEEKDFFLQLFPEVRKMGIINNYDFVNRMMFAKPAEVKNITDAFFVIIKSIFTPDMGEQKNAVMTRFQMKDRKGYIIYNLSKAGNYFSCDVITDADSYYKVYAKDKNGKLSLEEVFAVISTLSEPDQ